MKKRIIPAVCALAVLSGCSVNVNVESLIEPPQLNETQAELHAVLTESIGREFGLKYPQSGEHRSAYVLSDIDTDGEDEALVFYELKSGAGAGSVRVSILDKKDGDWVSVYDSAGIGNEIDTVMITSIGDAPDPLVFIGYSDTVTNEKYLRAHRYRDGSFDIIISGEYSAFDVCDITGDGLDDLICFSQDGTSAYAEVWNRFLQPREESDSVSASLKAAEGSGFLLRDVVEVDANAEIIGTLRGNVGRDTPALFVDVMVNGMLETQILYYRSGILINPLRSSGGLGGRTARAEGYRSMDIDLDGVIEIPVLKPFGGYEDTTDKIYMTEWYVFENSGLLKKYSSYYNQTYGYCFILPSAWVNTVTVLWDETSDEAVICIYNPESDRNMTELMRICVVKRGSGAEKTEEGYLTVRTQGQLEYLIKLSDASSELGSYMSITDTEAMFSFIVI